MPGASVRRLSITHKPPQDFRRSRILAEVPASLPPVILANSASVYQWPVFRAALTRSKCEAKRLPSFSASKPSLPPNGKGRESPKSECWIMWSIVAITSIYKPPAFGVFANHPAIRTYRCPFLISDLAVPCRNPRNKTAVPAVFQAVL